MGQRDQSTQVGVALLVLGQQRQVDRSAGCVDEAVLEGDLDARDRLNARAAHAWANSIAPCSPSWSVMASAR